MTNIQLVSYRLKKDRLELKLDNQDLIQENYFFQLIDRETKEEFVCPAQMTRYEAESVLSISLLVVKFNEEANQGILDVLIKDDIGTCYIPVMENLPLEDKIYKYSVNSHQINYRSSAIPYLTTKNSLSIVFGNSSEIVKTFTSEIKLKAAAPSLQFMNREIHFNVSLKSIENAHSFMVIFENRSSKKSIILKHEVIEKNREIIRIKAKLDENLTYNDRYDLYIECRKGHKVFKTRIGFKDNSIKRGENKFFDPLKISNGQYVLPYITTNGEVSCFVGDNVSVAKTLGRVVKKESIDIERYLFRKNEVDLFLCKEQLDIINSFQEKKFLIQGSSYSILREVPKDSVRISDQGRLSIQINKVFKEGMYKEGEKWTLFIMLEGLLKVEEVETINLSSTPDAIRSNDYSDFNIAVALKPVETEEKKENLNFIEEQQNELLLCSFILASNWMPDPVSRYSKPFPIGEGEISIISCISDNREMMFIIGDEEVYSSQVYKRISTLLDIDDLRIQNTVVSFGFLDEEILLKDSMRLYFKERKTKEEWGIPFHVKNERIEFDIQQFVDRYVDLESRWDTFVQLSYSNVIEEGKLGLFSENVKPASRRYFSSIEKSNDNEKETEASEEELVTLNVVTPYLTVKNELSIVIRPELNLCNEKYKFKTSITNFKMNKAVLHFKALIEVANVMQIEVEKIRLRFRNKATKIEYDLRVEESKISATKVAISFDIDLTKYQWQPFYWDLFAIVKIDNLNEVIYIKLKNPSKNIEKDINKEIVKYEYHFDPSFMLYPYITQDRSLALCYRERASYETSSYKYKEKLAYIVYKVFKKRLDRKNIWLGYEKFSSTAQDNGYYFFEYCYKNNKHNNFYYIIKSDAPDYKDLKKMKNKVIKFMSFKHMLYLFSAKLLISSESKGHSYDIRIQKGELKKALDSKKFVFLQHGVTALKKVDYVFKKTPTNAVNLFVATSDYEKNIINNYFGYDDREIPVTGFARWDALKDKSYLNSSKEILIMPTWRSWMDGIPKEEFLKTEYYCNYSELLQSPALYEILEKEDVWLSFLLHPKFLEHIGQFKVLSDRVKVHEFGTLKVNELLMSSSLLITDYSSVAWEMYYMRKPTIFYQFDAEKYQKFQGSYLDMNHELFGERAYDNSGLLNILQEYVQRDFKEKEKFSQMRSKYFKYIDSQNSERIYKAILSNQRSLSFTIPKKKREVIFEKLQSQKLIRKLWSIGKRNMITQKLALRIRTLFNA